MEQISKYGPILLPMIVNSFETCWKLLKKHKLEKCMETHVKALFEKHGHMKEYRILIDAVKKNRLNALTIVEWFAKIQKNIKTELINLVLSRIIDYLNDLKGKKTERCIENLCLEVGNGGILFGSLEPDDEIQTRLHLKKYMKITNYSRSNGVVEIMHQLGKYKINATKISRVDRYNDMKEIKTEHAIFIITMNGVEFEKAFLAHVWHEGTSAQYYHDNENTEKFLRNQCTDVWVDDAICSQRPLDYQNISEPGRIGSISSPRPNFFPQYL
ncbi:hypothetical protein SNEBB_002762 [Seison nebaliae]|nr:hypothetical protein SNEBB_002762 [Seison nebaliae]